VWLKFDMANIYLALTQSIYFLITGLWPILHMRSFLAVTGPKTDLWLVKTVGSLIAVIGCVLAVAAWRQAISSEVILLAAGSAATLMTVDVVYTMKRVIPKIYLADAIVEALLIVAWWFASHFDEMSPS
jgi:hypothetical protein